MKKFRTPSTILDVESVSVYAPVCFPRNGLSVGNEWKRRAWISSGMELCCDNSRARKNVETREDRTMESKLSSG